MRYPGAWWLAPVLVAYVVTLWKLPLLWATVVPMLLPTLDLSPWTGWFFIDEFDLFVLSTVAVKLWTARSADAYRPYLSRIVTVLIVAFALVYLLALIISVLPLAPM